MCSNLTRCTIAHPAPIHYLHHPPSVHPLSVQKLYQDANTDASASIPVNHIPHSGVCRLPKLRTLELRGFGPPLSFATNLDLPSLRELIVLSYPYTVVKERLDGTVELFRKFGDGLTDVLLQRGSFTLPRLLDMLRHLPNVVNLRLFGEIPWFPPEMLADLYPVRFNSVLEKLTPRSQESNDNGVAGGTCYCPKLKKFGCTLEEYTEVSEEVIAQFIAARRNRLNTDVALLTSFVVVFTSPRPTQSIRGRLEEMGVDLEDMVLITAYQGQEWEPSGPREFRPKFDVDVVSREHQDFISTVGLFIQTLGDLTL